jgi:plasmid stabilization system protein ParE
MRKPYRVASEAEEDLDSIWWYVYEASGNERIANTLIDDITDKFALIGDMPSVGRACNDIGIGMHRVPVRENYIIYYQPRPRGGVIIFRVIHGARDQKKAWKQKGKRS